MPRGKGAAINVNSVDQIVTYDDEDTTATGSAASAKKRRRVVLNTHPPHSNILLDERSTHNEATEQASNTNIYFDVDEDYFLHCDEEHGAPTPAFAGSTNAQGSRSTDIDAHVPRTKVRAYCLPLPVLLIN